MDAKRSQVTLKRRVTKLDISKRQLKCVHLFSFKHIKTKTVNMHFVAGQLRLDMLVLSQRIFVVYNETALSILGRPAPKCICL